MKLLLSLLALTQVQGRITTRLWKDDDLNIPYATPLVVFDKAHVSKTKKTLVFLDKLVDDGNYYPITNLATGAPVFKISNPTLDSDARTNRILANLTEDPICLLVDNDFSYFYRICHQLSTVNCPVRMRYEGGTRLGFKVEVFNQQNNDWMEMRVVENIWNRGAQIYITSTIRDESVMVAKFQRVEVRDEPYVIKRRTRNLVITIAPNIDTSLILMLADFYIRGEPNQEEEYDTTVVYVPPPTYTDPANEPMIINNSP